MARGLIDALLVLSFGGPEGPDDVRPFLERVTAGRNVPAARLDEVASHYAYFDGVSPINGLNRELIRSVEAELRAVGIDLPVYFGNRNWHPLVQDTVAEMATDGVREALVFTTSAWGGVSGCRRYQEDISGARKTCGAGAPDLIKLRQYFDHPLFVEANAAAVTDASSTLGTPARLVFTAHSVPIGADALQGPDGSGHWYSRQVRTAARLVAERAGVADHDVVWQSRSGSPATPWLGPDIADHLDDLKARGWNAVVVSPIGFVSDHVEVAWDLDTEAASRAAELGMEFARARTVGSDKRFVAMIVELVAEQLEGRPPRRLSDLAVAGCTLNGRRCAAECCATMPERAL